MAGVVSNPLDGRIHHPGTFPGIPIDQYHADKRWISSTGLKHAKRSMAEFKMWQDGFFDSDDRTHFDFGNAFELALLDPDHFDREVAILQTEAWTSQALEEKPDLISPKLSKAYKDLEKAYRAEHAGKYFISDTGKESFDTIENMLESCYKDAVVQRLLANVEYNQSLYWIDKPTGLWMKTRPDFTQVRHNVLVNLKTDIDANPDTWMRHKVFNLDYPLQAIVEIEGAIQSGLMETVDHYYWLVVEKNPPYCAQIYELAQGDIEVLRDEYRFLLDRIMRSETSGLWPGYTDRADNPHGIIELQIPAWYRVYQI